MVFPSMDNAHVPIFEGSISFCYLAEEQNNTWETWSGSLGVLSGRVYPNKWKKVPDVK